MVGETQTVYGLIEQETPANYIARLIGFPHVEFHGTSVAEAEGRLRRAALDYTRSGELVLETRFVKLVRVELPPAAQDPDSLPPTKEAAPTSRSPEAVRSRPSDLGAELRSLLERFDPVRHGGEFPADPPQPMAKYKRFGPDGPPYEVGQPLGQLDNGDWLVEVTMVQTNEKVAYRLSRIVEDPDA